MNLLVDDLERARLNRERVANGYGNKGYVNGYQYSYGHWNRKTSEGTSRPTTGILRGALPAHWKQRRQWREETNAIGGWQTE